MVYYKWIRFRCRFAGWFIALSVCTCKLKLVTSFCFTYNRKVFHYFERFIRMQLIAHMLNQSFTFRNKNSILFWYSFCLLAERPSLFPPNWFWMHLMKSRKVTENHLETQIINGCFDIFHSFYVNPSNRKLFGIWWGAIHTAMNTGIKWLNTWMIEWGERIYFRRTVSFISSF